MKNLKRFSLILLALLVVVTSAPYAFAIDDTENNIDYQYDSDTKTLTFSGSGKLYMTEKLFKELGEKGITDNAQTLIISGGIEFVDGSTVFPSYIFKSLKEVKLDDGITNIYNAFEKSETLKTVKLPSTLECIESCAFIGCESLSEITIPDGVKYIDRQAFEKCTSLEAINIPDSVERIGYSAFEGCSSLKTVEIGKNVDVVEQFAFESTKWYNSLEDEFVIVGDGVLIKYNGSDKDVTIPQGVKCVSSAFGDKSGQVREYNSIAIPETVKQLHGIFEGVKISDVKLPDSIEVIGDIGTLNLETIIIPPYVKTNYKGALGSFVAKRIIITGEQPEIKLRDSKLYVDIDDTIPPDMEVTSYTIDYNGFFAANWSEDDINNLNNYCDNAIITSTFSCDTHAEPKMKGDVDGDGEITSADATCILRAVASLAYFNEKQINSASTMGEPYSTADATRILRVVAKLENSL